MEKHQIIKQLKEFYPTDISLDDIAAYANSEPYKKKKSYIDSAWSERNEWNLLKASLSDLSTEIWDYSFMGGSPCYHFSFSQEQNKEILFSLFVSVILPYYAIRIMNISNFDKSFDPISAIESRVFEKLENKVKNVFPKHRIIRDKAFLQTKVDIFEADGEYPPSIQHLLFSTIET